MVLRSSHEMRHPDAFAGGLCKELPSMGHDVDWDLRSVHRRLRAHRRRDSGHRELVPPCDILRHRVHDNNGHFPCSVDAMRYFQWTVPITSGTICARQGRAWACHDVCFCPSTGCNQRSSFHLRFQLLGSIPHSRTHLLCLCEKSGTPSSPCFRSVPDMDCHTICPALRFHVPRRES